MIFEIGDFIKKLHLMTKSALMVCLSLILKQIKLFSMPFGGSVTFGSLAPLIILSNKYGVKTGVFASFVCFVVHFIMSFKVPPAKSFSAIVLIIFLDYVLQYLLVGLSGFFGRFFSFGRFNKMYTGVAVSFILKILFSAVSGTVFWSEYAPGFLSIPLYSLAYSCAYLIPEFIITVIVIKKTENFI